MVGSSVLKMTIRKGKKDLPLKSSPSTSVHPGVRKFTCVFLLLYSCKIYYSITILYKLKNITWNICVTGYRLGI